MNATGPASDARIAFDQRGFALEATIFTMVIATIVMAALFTAAMTTFRTAGMELGNTRAIYAAEGGAEAAMAQLTAALEDGNLSDSELALLAPPTIQGFSFDSFDVQRLGGIVIEPITDGPFIGLKSLTQRVDIYSEAVDPIGNSGAVIVSAKAQAIPIFQFGVFYEKDLEITNGPPMYFDGWVHSNGNIFLSSNNSYFRDVITTPGSLVHDRKDNHDIKHGVHVADAGGTDVQLSFDSRSHPTANAFRARSHADFDDRVKTGAYAVDTLRLPLPGGMSAHEVIRVREGTDGSLERATKWAWKADFHVTIDLNAALNAGNTCTYITMDRGTTGLATPGLADCEAIFDFNYEKFVDGRESRWVDVLDVNIAALNAWMSGAPADRQVSIFYVEFTGAGTAPDLTGDGVYPAVRLQNGAWLFAPLSVATEWPMIVDGDYNTVGWQPAAVVGDNLTILSNAWDDADPEHQNTFGSNPGHAFPVNFSRTNASNTSVFAAVMAGHSSTPCDHESPGCGGSVQYGGGLENFPRFLERWSGRTLTYYGSLVSLYEAQMATGTWGGSYYSPPGRNWFFDTRFRDPANLPPGTPVVGNVIHTAFRPVH